MGATFHRAGCCCAVRCAGCQDAEPDAVVTISGTCEEWCDDFAGTYLFSSTAHEPGGDYCWWTLTRADPATPNVNLLYCEGTAKWYARIKGIAEYFGGAVDDPCTGITTDNWKEVTITCTAGVLSGSFSLDGLGDCAGCSASVTLE